MSIINQIITNAPFYIIVLYVLLFCLLFVSSKFRANFADSHKGNSVNSWIRYMGSFVVISAIIIALAQVAGGKEINYAVVSTMLTIAFGGKVAQKHVENKLNNTDQIDVISHQESATETIDEASK